MAIEGVLTYMFSSRNCGPFLVFRVSGLGLRVKGLGFRVQGLIASTDPKRDCTLEKRPYRFSE